jgi:hypothetical protein
MEMQILPATNSQITDVVQTLQLIFYICPRISHCSCLAVRWHPLLLKIGARWPLDFRSPHASQSISRAGGTVCHCRRWPSDGAVAEWKYDGLRCTRRTGTAAPKLSVGICWIPRINIRMPSSLSGLCSQVIRSFDGCGDCWRRINW